MEKILLIFSLTSLLLYSNASATDLHIEFKFNRQGSFEVRADIKSGEWKPSGVDSFYGIIKTFNIQVQWEEDGKISAYKNKLLDFNSQKLTFGREIKNNTPNGQFPITIFLNGIEKKPSESLELFFDVTVPKGIPQTILLKKEMFKIEGYTIDQFKLSRKNSKPMINLLLLKKGTNTGGLLETPPPEQTIKMDPGDQKPADQSRQHLETPINYDMKSQFTNNLKEAVIEYRYKNQTDYEQKKWDLVTQSLEIPKDVDSATIKVYTSMGTIIPSVMDASILTLDNCFKQITILKTMPSDLISLRIKNEYGEFVYGVFNGAPGEQTPIWIPRLNYAMHAEILLSIFFEGHGLFEYPLELDKDILEIDRPPTKSITIKTEPFARIIVKTPYETISGTSDSNGDCKIRVPPNTPGWHEMTIDCPGYERMVKHISLQETELNFKLQIIDARAKPRKINFKNPGILRNYNIRLQELKLEVYDSHGHKETKTYPAEEVYLTPNATVKLVDPNERLTFRRHNITENLDTGNLDYVIDPETLLSQIKINFPTTTDLGRLIGKFDGNILFTSNQNIQKNRSQTIKLSWPLNEPTDTKNVVICFQNYEPFKTVIKKGTHEININIDSLQPKKPLIAIIIGFHEGTGHEYFKEIITALNEVSKSLENNGRLVVGIGKRGQYNIINPGNYKFSSYVQNEHVTDLHKSFNIAQKMLLEQQSLIMDRPCNGSAGTKLIYIGGYPHLSVDNLEINSNTKINIISNTQNKNGKWEKGKWVIADQKDDIKYHLTKML
jgi:hypothetical protein